MVTEPADPALASSSVDLDIRAGRIISVRWQSETGVAHLSVDALFVDDRSLSILAGQFEVAILDALAAAQYGSTHRRRRSGRRRRNCRTGSGHHSCSPRRHVGPAALAPGDGCRPSNSRRRHMCCMTMRYPSTVQTRWPPTNSRWCSLPRLPVPSRAGRPPRHRPHRCRLRGRSGCPRPGSLRTEPVRHRRTTPFRRAHPTHRRYRA